MKLFQSLEPDLRRTLLVLGASGFLFWSSLASLLPTLPLYVQSLGSTHQQVGIIMGAFAIGLLLFRAPLGRLADYRSRKLVVLIGLAAVAIAPMGYLHFSTIPLLLATRVFHGISIAAFTTAYMALVVDIAPEQHRGELIGYMSLVNPIGVAIGPAMGGLLLEAMGYQALFIMSTLLGAVGFWCAWQVQEPTKPSSVRDSVGDRPSQWQQIHDLLANHALSIPTLVLLLVGIAFGAMSAFLPLFMQAIEVKLNPGFFYTAAAISSFWIRILVGRASDLYGRGMFITLSLVFYTASMVLLAGHPIHNPQPWLFLLAGALEGAGSGILIPTTVALVADRSDPSQRGQVFGVCIGGFDLGMALGGPLLGMVAQTFGYTNLFTCAAVLTATAIALFSTQSSKTLSYSFKFATGQIHDIYGLKSVPVMPLSRDR